MIWLVRGVRIHVNAQCPNDAFVFQEVPTIYSLLLNGVLLKQTLILSLVPTVKIV